MNEVPTDSFSIERFDLDPEQHTLQIEIGHENPVN